jgi:hypothetical protein
MKLLIQITTPGLLEGMPEGLKTVEVEADSPAEVMFEMQRRGCDKDYITRVLEHLGPIFAESYPHWYGEPDQVKISKDLQAVHPAYGFTERG